MKDEKVATNNVCNTGKKARPTLKNTRNTEPANQKRRQTTNEHDVLVYEALQPLLEQGSAHKITYMTMAHFLNTRTDLLTQRGNEFTRDSVWRILKRVKDRNL